MVETELKRSPRDKTIASGQEVQTNNGLEDRRFACTLRAEHGYSGELDELLHANISQVIDDSDELF